MEIVEALGKAVTLAANMGWQTWWALVLGFSVSGAVRTLISQEQMSRVLGGRGIKEVMLGTFFGAASSSCSYGAVATTNTLFKKGASAESSLAAFQFASTNIVIELGLVMWVLLGWQFVAANIVAGVFLITLLALCFHFVVPNQLVEEARSFEFAEQEGSKNHQCHENNHHQTEEGDGEARYKDSSSGGVLFALSRHAFRDWRMLWKEILIGFFIAGLVGAFVPSQWWTSLFAVSANPSFPMLVLSCIFAVIIGVVTFVCSVGNVPFAVILWTNQVPFGAIMSFIFADLIVPPIISAYRKYYGPQMAAVLTFLIAGCAVVSGVIIHYLWQALSLIPPAGMAGGTAPESYTFYLNIVFSAIFLIELWAAHRKPCDADSKSVQRCEAKSSCHFK